MKPSDIPETQLNDILRTMWDAGIETDGMVFPLHGYDGENVRIETDFGVVTITKGK